MDVMMNSTDLSLFYSFSGFMLDHLSFPFKHSSQHFSIWFLFFELVVQNKYCEILGPYGY